MRIIAAIPTCIDELLQQRFLRLRQSLRVNVERVAPSLGELEPAVAREEGAVPQTLHHVVDGDEGLADPRVQIGGRKLARRALVVVCLERDARQLVERVDAERQLSHDLRVRNMYKERKMNIFSFGFCTIRCKPPFTGLCLDIRRRINAEGACPCLCHAALLTVVGGAHNSPIILKSGLV